ncbi:unnamed protein product [Owenia fusiformis]|uniref:Uncharacterized protein n=1 Tax=Owenia fusiformis TaxID=6347 RepID=A0A8J1UNV7_OWEFU|nr:unnamed protein product [Owenia fusiformis]
MDSNQDENTTKDEKLLQQELEMKELTSYINEECEYVKDCDGKTMKVLYIDGVAHECVFRSSIHSDARTFTAHVDDVWIMSWPRSGSHWVWEIIQRLLHGIDSFVGPLQKDLSVFDLNTDGIKHFPQPRVISSHLRREFAPEDIFKKGSKVVYLVRDPRDAMVSWYKFIQRQDAFQYDGSRDGFLSLYFQDKVPRGTWEKHTKGWLQESRNNKNIFLLNYENLRHDPLKYIRELASFLRPGTTYNETELMRHKEKTDLCTMQQKNSAYEQYHKKGGLGLQYDKGKIGTWKDWFTVAQLEDYKRHYHQYMDDVDNSDLGYIDMTHT